MQAKAFLTPTGVQIEIPTTHNILKHVPFQHHPPHTFTPTHLLPPPKNTPKQVTEKALCQKVQKQVM